MYKNWFDLICLPDRHACATPSFLLKRACAERLCVCSIGHFKRFEYQPMKFYPPPQEASHVQWIIHRPNSQSQFHTSFIIGTMNNKLISRRSIIITRKKYSRIN